MSAAETARLRVGRGVKKGGEFTAQQRPESTVTLADPPISDRERFRADSDAIRDELRAHFPDLTLCLGGSTRFLVLDMIFVPKPLRGQGLARAAMQDLVDAADGAGRPMALTPDSGLGSSKARLVAFYRGFGFVPNSGRNKDFGIMEAMIRPVLRPANLPS